MIVQDNTLNAFVAGGQRIFINTGLIMRTETPNQLIGVLAHETGHIAGGHLARMQEELREAHARCRSSRRSSARGAMAGGAVSGGGGAGRRRLDRPAPAAANAPGSLLSLPALHPDPGKLGRPGGDDLPAAHRPVAQGRDRIPAHPAARGAPADRPARSLPDDPSADARAHRRRSSRRRRARPTPTRRTRRRFLDDAPSHRGQADGLPHARRRRCSTSPKPTARCRRATPARSRSTARARWARRCSRIDGLIKEYPNDPYFHEVRGQMLFENGRAAEAVPSYRRAVQLLPASGIIKIDFARALLDTNKPDNDREAVRNLELARAAGVRQLRPVAPDGRGLFQAEQSRHDLAGPRRDGGRCAATAPRRRPMPTPPRASCQPARRPGSAPRTSRPISTRGRARDSPSSEITLHAFASFSSCAAAWSPPAPSSPPRRPRRAGWPPRTAAAIAPATRRRSASPSATI